MAGDQGALVGVAVHETQHEDLPRGHILNDGGNQPAQLCGHEQFVF